MVSGIPHNRRQKFQSPDAIVTSVQLFENHAVFAQCHAFLILQRLCRWILQIEGIPDICHFMYTGKIFG